MKARRAPTIDGWRGAYHFFTTAGYAADMGAIFSVTADPVTNVVRHRLAGFFEADDVQRYIALRDAEHAKLTCGPHEHVTLVDVRDMKIQPQDIVQAFGTMLANPRHRSRKLAFVFSLSLARMQLLRASEGRNARFFTDMREAEAWLMEPGRADAPPQAPAAAPRARPLPLPARSRKTPPAPPAQPGI
jgi:hypothetical protein